MSLTAISRQSHPIAMSTRNHLTVISFGIETGTAGPVFSHARVTRPPTTKVTRRPVATPAWREARRVLERGRRGRDDRRRGGRIDDDGGAMGERTAEWKAGKEGRESANGSGTESARRVRREERVARMHPHYDPLHPRFKNRSYLPYFTPSPLYPAGCCAVSGTVTHCATDTERAFGLI